MKINFNPTGVIFDLPENICKKLISEDRCNYSVVPQDKANAKQSTKNKKSSNVQVINVKGEKTEKPKEKNETKTDKTEKSEDKAE